MEPSGVLGPSRPQGGGWCLVPTQQQRQSREAPDRAPSSSCVGNASRPVAGLQLPAHASVSACLSPSSGLRRKPWFRDIKVSRKRGCLGWKGPAGPSAVDLRVLAGPGARAAGSSLPPPRLPPPPSPSLLLFPRPAGGCGDHGAAAKWSFLFLLFLFVNPGVSCPVPSLTYSSPLHLAGRGSCAGICEDRVLWPWCCPRAVCRRPQAPPRPAGPAPLRSRPGQQELRSQLCPSPEGAAHHLGET